MALCSREKRDRRERGNNRRIAAGSDRKGGYEQKRGSILAAKVEQAVAASVANRDMK